MPVVLKIVLNIIFFVVYIIVFSLIAGLVIWAIKSLTGGSINDISPEFFDKFQVVFAFVVLLVTILLKKYFYISLSKEEVIVVEK